MEKNFSKLNKEELEKLLAQKQVANAGLKTKRTDLENTNNKIELAITHQHGNKKLDEGNAARGTRNTRILGNIKEKANNLKNQIGKIFEDANKEVKREIAKGERDIHSKEEQTAAKRLIKDLEDAYARIQENLATSAGTLTPKQLAEESAKTLGLLKADAQMISDKYGIPMGNFPALQIPQKETPPDFTDATEWEANTATDENGKPYYKPYVAPKVSDFPEYKPWETPQEEQQKRQPGPGEEVDTDWQRTAENIKSKLPKIDASYAPMQELKAMMLEALKLENLKFNTGLNKNKDELSFSTSQKVGTLDQDIAAAGEKLGLSDVEMRNLAKEVAAKNGLTYTNPDDTSGHPDVEKEETPSLLDRFVASQKLGAEAIANREGMMFGEKPEGTPDTPKPKKEHSRETHEFTEENKAKLEQLITNKIRREEANTESALFAENQSEFALDHEIGTMVRDMNITPSDLDKWVEEIRAKLKPADEPEKDERDYFQKMFDDAERTIPGFAEMTKGQQVLVMKGIHNRVLTNVQEGAENDFQARLADQDWAGKTWSRLWEKTITAAYEKRAFLELGGTEEEPKKGLWNRIKSKLPSPYEKIWKEAIDTPPEESQLLREEFVQNSGDIVSVIKDSGLDVAYYAPVFNERGAIAKNENNEFLKGEPVINYATKDIRTRNPNYIPDPVYVTRPDGSKYDSRKSSGMHEFMGDERSLIQFQYNQAATEFGNIPQEWSAPEAKRSQRKAYEAARQAYDEHKHAYLAEVAKFEKEQGTDTPEEVASQLVSESQATVETMQYLFAHPDVTNHLANLGEHSALRLGLGTDATQERAALLAGGMATRNLIMKGAPLWNTFALIAAPLTGAVVGATRSVLRSKKEYRKLGKLARRGEGRVSLNEFDSAKVTEIKKGQNSFRFGMGNVTRHIGRMNDYIKRIENAHSPEEERQLREEFKLRIDFIDKKNQLGQINVGKDLATQYEFKRKLYESKRVLEAGEKQDDIYHQYELGNLYNDIGKDATLIANEKDPARRAELINKVYEKYPELAGLWKEKGLKTPGIKDATDEIRRIATEISEIAPSIADAGTVHEFAIAIMQAKTDEKRTELIRKAYKKFPVLKGLWAENFDEGREDNPDDIDTKAQEIFTQEARTKRLIDVYARYPGLKGLWEKNRIDESTDSPDAIVNKSSQYLIKMADEMSFAIDQEKDPTARKQITEDIYKKYPEFKGLLQEKNAQKESNGEEEDDVNAIMKKLTDMTRGMRDTAENEKYKVGQLFGDIALTYKKLSKAEDSHHRPDTEKRAEIIADFGREHPDFKSIWAIAPGEEVVHDGHIVNPYDGKRAMRKAAAMIQGMKESKAGYEKIREENPRRAINNPNVTGTQPQFKNGRLVSYKEGVEIEHRTGNTQNSLGLISRMGDRNQEQVKSARQWKTVKEAAKSAVLGALFAEIFAPHHLPPEAAHTGAPHIPPTPHVPTPQPRGPLPSDTLHTPEIHTAQPIQPAPQVQPTHPTPEAAPAPTPIKFHLETQRADPGLETEMPAPIENGTTLNGEPRYEPDSLFTPDPAPQNPGDISVGYNDGAPQGNEVQVSYNDADSYVLPGKEGHIDRVSLRMLDKDFGTHHFLGIGRHTTHMPEWKAIEDVPVNHALIDEGGMLIHAHKQFFDTLRQKGFDADVYPNPDETVGSYADRVYHAMARMEESGTPIAPPAASPVELTPEQLAGNPVPGQFQPLPNNAPVPATPGIEQTPVATPTTPPAAIVTPPTPQPVVDVEALDLNTRYNLLFKANPAIETAYQEMQKNVSANTDASAYRAVGIGESADLATAQKIASGDAEFNILNSANVDNMRMMNVNTLTTRTFDLPNGHHVVMVTEEVPKGGAGPIPTAEAGIPTPAPTLTDATEAINARGHVEISSPDMLRKMLRGTDSIPGGLSLKHMLKEYDGYNFTVAKAIGQTQEGGQLAADETLKIAGTHLKYSPNERIFTFTKTLDTGNIEVYEIRAHK